MDTSSLIEAMGLDEVDSEREYLTVITEYGHVVDASFMLAHVADFSAKNGRRVIMLNCHNTRHHFTAINAKLGLSYNCIHNDMLLNGSAIEENILEQVKKAIVELLSVESNNIMLIIEQPSNLFLLGYTPFQIFQFIHDLASYKKSIQTTISLKYLNNCLEFQSLINELKHSSDLRIDVHGLKTGTAKDVTGAFYVQKRHKQTLGENFIQTEYHYQLLDRKVRVFAPGFIN